MSFIFVVGCLCLTLLPEARQPGRESFMVIVTSLSIVITIVTQGSLHSILFLVRSHRLIIDLVKGKYFWLPYERLDIDKLKQ